MKQRTQMHRHILSLSLLVVIIPLLAACRGAETPLTVPAGANPGDLTLTPCQVTLARTEYDAECGTLVVPENRSVANARLIALPVVRLAATGTAPVEPIFWLSGGPGSSNVTYAPPAWLLRDHDVVLVGYRGVDGSVRLDCPEMATALRRSRHDLLSEASLDVVTTSMAQCASRLQSEGVDLGGYTIPEVVEDMEAARVALGYGPIDLLSHSYGTRVALIYAWTHPESLHRSAMAGVNPPGHFFWTAEAIDAKVHTYAGLCAQDPQCSTQTADLYETIRSVAQDMPRRWLVFPINPGKVRLTTFVMLYNRGSAALVFDTYMRAAKGDPSGLAMMSLATDFLVPNMFVWGDMLAKGGSADLPTALALMDQLTAPDTAIGSPHSELIWPTAAKAWPITPIPEALRTVEPSDVEMLLLGGSVDVSTPPEFATTELLPALSSGQQLVLHELGHNDMIAMYPDALERLLTSFYATGVADGSLYPDTPMTFKVGLGFPAMIKLASAVIVVLVVALGYGAYAVFRGIRRKSAAQTSGGSN